MRRAVAICGPTASGKTGLADEVSSRLTELCGSWTTTLVVDSMQVYRELPVVTNQERGRPAELVGVTSVTDDWTMARHRLAADKVLGRTEGPFVLDAGTGMYLNSILVDIDIAPKVSSQIREEAEAVTSSAANSRRSTREKELEIVGYPGRASIWSGNLRYDTTLIYLRPDRAILDSAITRRSKKIVLKGLQEVEKLRGIKEAGFSPNPSVEVSIGVRELMEVLSGTLALEDAETRISARTRKLARRQMRWFDKLARMLEGRAKTAIMRDKKEATYLNSMFDIIGS